MTFFLGLSSPVLIASSNRVKILNPNYPMQGHLSLTHSPDKLMLVSVIECSIIYSAFN